MHEQDYIMRLIREMIRTVMVMLTGRASELSAEMLESREDGKLLEKLLELTEEGRINEAENLLYDLPGRSSLMISLLFYSYLNERTDEFLEANDFSREEIRQGVYHAMERSGLNGMASVFLSDI